MAEGGEAVRFGESGGVLSRLTELQGALRVSWKSVQEGI